MSSMSYVLSVLRPQCRMSSMSRPQRPVLNVFCPHCPLVPSGRLELDMQIFHPLCYIIVEASNHDNGVPIWNPAWFISTVFEGKASATCDEGLEAFSIVYTWHNLCSETTWTAIATQQHNGVGKRGWRPRCVRISRHTVIEFKIIFTAKWCS